MQGTAGGVGESSDIERLTDMPEFRRVQHRRKASPECLERLSEKSLGDLWSAGFGSATLQKEVLRAPFEQFVRSSAREFETFQTVSEDEFSESQHSPALKFA